MIFSINDIWGHNLADPDPSKNLLDCYSDPKFPCQISRFISCGLQISCFLGSHFIDRLAQVHHDVKTIQNMKGLSCFLCNHLKIRPPHIAADVSQLGCPLFTEPAEESQQGLYLPLLSNPEQSLAVCIDLIDQGQVLVTNLPLDLIDTNGLNIR